MSPFPNSKTPNPGPKLLISYFRSGWAFLIPYLAAYLLYAWLKWPVNPTSNGEELIKGVSESVGSLSAQQINRSPSSISRFPCLLHVYWFLHGLHFILGCLALHTWWRNIKKTSCRIQLSTSNLALWPLVPWLCLALLFWIPGVYLEFPADPWEHYARINQWRDFFHVSENPTWFKSSYFLAYSFIGRIAPPLFQLKWFNIYYTSCCLLLCWHYYRLARATGLNCREAHLFVLLNALLSGNYIFGFYRYYGMSSSLFAQLGAVALTRMLLEAAKSPQLSLRSLFGLSSTDSPATGLFFSVPCLITLTAFNHVQGLGIAGLGITAVIAWRLIEWRRSTLKWCIFAAVGLSAATILWFPRNPTLDEFYRPGGWLNGWYGFNLLSHTSPAFARAAAIIGVFGLINLMACFPLAFRNSITFWLTFFPWVALSLPCVTIPLASALASRQLVEITTFSRMLFAVPSGLALVELSKIYFVTGDEKSRRRHEKAAFPLLVGTMCLIFIMGPQTPSYNRLFNVFSRPPNDLQMQTILTAREEIKPSRTSMAILPIGASAVLQAIGDRNTPSPNRAPLLPLNLRLKSAFGVQDADYEKSLVWYLPTKPIYIFTPYSSSAYLSGHWPPQEVALDFSAHTELNRKQKGLANEP